MVNGRREEGEEKPRNSAEEISLHSQLAKQEFSVDSQGVQHANVTLCANGKVLLFKKMLKKGYSCQDQDVFFTFLGLTIPHAKV